MELLGVDETTVVMTNVTNRPLCNLSGVAHTYSSNPYIPAWYLQVRIFFVFE